MAEARRKFDQDFREGAVKPIAQVARELGVNEGTLGNWVSLDRRRRGAGDGAGPGTARGRGRRAGRGRARGAGTAAQENTELAMKRDVLKRSVALWLSG